MSEEARWAEGPEPREPAEPDTPWELTGVPVGRGVPADARRMGFDRNTEEGALLDFAGMLDGRKAMHRLVAWVLLIAFGLPSVLAVLVYSERILEWLFTT